MKWIIRIFGLIIGLFLLGAVAGFFMSSKFSVERSRDIFVEAEDVFPYLSDLEVHAIWSPWHSGSPNYTVGGASLGVGQEAAWTCDNSDCLPGSQEITNLQNSEFVQSVVNIDGQLMDATYALMNDENSDGSLTVLMKVETDLGGFPFIQRLFKFREKKALGDKIDVGLSELEALLVADGLAD